MFAWMMLNDVDKEICNLSRASDDIRSFSIETRMMMLMTAAQVTRALRVNSLLKRIGTRFRTRDRSAGKNI